MNTLRTAALFAMAACTGAPRVVDLDGAHWRELPSGSTASLRGLAPIDRHVCWCTGSGGTVLRTVDGGASWQRLVVPGAESLDLRSVVAFSADVALVANAGAPARIFRTEDGGRTWRMVHEDTRPEIFLDALVSHDGVECWSVGDPIGGAFVLLHSGDGGRSWQPSAAPPHALAGEAAFAASGSCLCARGSSLWLVTGGGASRCLRSSDGGRSFTSVRLPLRATANSQGAFSVAFAEREGVAVGGDYREPEDDTGTAAWSEDGGATWHAPATGAPGYRSSVTFLPGTRCCIAAGERSCSWSADGGRNWRPLPGPGCHAVAAASDGSVWAAGGRGRTARLEFQAP